MRAFDQLSKTTIYLLDGISGTTLVAGVINGQLILMVLGGVASICAIINHSDQFLKRRKQVSND
jgi:hypothetical protein